VSRVPPSLASTPSTMVAATAVNARPAPRSRPLALAPSPPSPCGAKPLTMPESAEEEPAAEAEEEEEEAAVVGKWQ
jgi:hypothetical protein